MRNKMFEKETKLIECVPNISEGRDRKIIETIAATIEQVPEVKLLHIDSDPDANRTVVTFAGTPKKVGQAAFNLIKQATELIDMSQHNGVHPRIGAVDVCPFIPLQHSSLDDCIALANRLGKQVGEELKIPVYLYAAAAKSASRRNLADCRRGEYENIAEKIIDPNWIPDFGPAIFHVRSGIINIGARNFLLAYNVNLNTTSVTIAKTIAGKIRRSAKLPGIKAIGWYLDRFGIAQVSTNLTDFRLTSLYRLFEAVKEEANVFGVKVTGSELVGLAPKEALLNAGAEYFHDQGKTPPLSERETLDKVVTILGLNDVSPFSLDEKILENQLGHFGTQDGSNTQ